MNTPAPTSWQWPSLRWRSLLALLGLFTVIGLWQGNTMYLAMLGDGSHISWGKPYLWELTGNLSGFLCGYIPYTAVVNAPRPGDRWGRFLFIHGAACALLAALAPPVFLGMRYVLYPLLGWGHYDYGPFRLRLPMEWQKIFIAYIVISGGIAFSLHLKENRHKALREAELSAKLQEAKLQVLSAQLDPHFLFNALNTISSVMYESLERTDRLLASLGQMLRDGLEGGSALWPLDRELAHLEAFLDFALARFGPRLRTETRAEPSLGNTLVPRFCLQRLAENAIKHNLDRIGQTLSLEIEVLREGERLCLLVKDDGVGFRDRASDDFRDEAGGIGLRNLRETLALCYGGTGILEIQNRPGGGAQVKLEIPLESSHA